jgi:hypothetical protein
MDQLEYLEILFNEVGLIGPAKRAWLMLEYGEKYADSLPSTKRSEVINRLKKMKEDQKSLEEDSHDPEEAFMKKSGYGTHNRRQLED